MENSTKQQKRRRALALIQQSHEYIQWVTEARRDFAVTFTTAASEHDRVRASIATWGTLIFVNYHLCDHAFVNTKHNRAILHSERVLHHMKSVRTQQDRMLALLAEWEVGPPPQELLNHFWCSNVHTMWITSLMFSVIGKQCRNERLEELDPASPTRVSMAFHNQNAGDIMDTWKHLHSMNSSCHPHALVVIDENDTAHNSALWCGLYGREAHKRPRPVDSYYASKMSSWVDWKLESTTISIPRGLRYLAEHLSPGITAELLGSKSTP